LRVISQSTNPNYAGTRARCRDSDHSTDQFMDYKNRTFFGLGQSLGRDHELFQPFCNHYPRSTSRKHSRSSCDSQELLSTFEILPGANPYSISTCIAPIMGSKSVQLFSKALISAASKASLVSSAGQPQVVLPKCSISESYCAGECQSKQLVHLKCPLPIMIRPQAGRPTGYPQPERLTERIGVCRDRPPGF
jgi:hypothetical protein